MAEQATTDSFIVRVYRYDTEDSGKLAGLIEATDGSGERTPFIDADELAAALHRSVGKGSGRRKKVEVKNKT